MMKRQSGCSRATRRYRSIRFLPVPRRRALYTVRASTPTRIDLSNLHPLGCARHLKPGGKIDHHSDRQRQTPLTGELRVATSLRDIVENFPKHRVLVLGDVMLDEYLTGNCSRISPEAPVPILAVSSSRTALGGAANTAANITALAGEATLIGLAGDDEAGRLLAETAAARGIDFVPVRDGR